MSHVHKTDSTPAVTAIDSPKLDADTLSHLIGCAKIRELEARLEAYFVDAQERLSTIQLLQKLKQKVIQGGDNFDGSKDAEFCELLEQAKKSGLIWAKTGWSSKEERDTLIDGLHVQITSKESENQTTFMRINRLMNLRAEAANLFSKMSGDGHSSKIRVLGRIGNRS